MDHKWSLFYVFLLTDRVSHSSDLWNNRVHGLLHVLFKVFRIDLQISSGVSAQFLFNEVFVHILQVIGSFMVRFFPTNNKNDHPGLCQKLKGNHSLKMIEKISRPFLWAKSQTASGLVVFPLASWSLLQSHSKNVSIIDPSLETLKRDLVYDMVHGMRSVGYGPYSVARLKFETCLHPW